MVDVREAIERMPDNPEGNIIWVVYNKDMIAAAEQMIIQVKGSTYFNKHVFVVTKDDAIPSSSAYPKQAVYFDPNLYDYLGLGHN